MAGRTATRTPARISTTPTASMAWCADAGDEVVDPRRQVLLPVREDVEELVQAEGDGGDREDGAQQHERLAGARGVTSCWASGAEKKRMAVMRSSGFLKLSILGLERSGVRLTNPDHV